MIQDLAGFSWRQPATWLPACGHLTRSDPRLAMKICFMGLGLPEGKVKYQDERVITLDQKFEPKKVTPFYAEFIKDDSQQCDVFLVSKDQVLDLLIQDMEKLETRRDRAADD